MKTADAAPPITLLQPPRQVAPVILTSPHSGRCYEPEFLAVSRLDALALRRSEDSFVEQLFGAAPRLGAPLLAANFPRAWCDPNREAWELDPGMFADPLPDYVNSNSPRVAAGLGTIARIVGAGEAIYARKLGFSEARQRIATCWEPFHAALRGLIGETVARFGVCLVIDCHSMPGAATKGGDGPDIVLGDRHGTSCAPAAAAFIQSELARFGLAIRRNDPYAGGYITRHYGRPGAGVHVLQLELARALYMDEQRLTRTGNFARLENQMEQFLATLLPASLSLLQPDQALAAE